MSLIEVENLTFGFDIQTDLLFKEASFSFDTTWKLGLVGRNGRGKTTFLKLLQGKYEFLGRIHHEKELNFSYFPAEIVDKSQITLYALQEISPFDQWKLEKELSLMSMDFEKIWQPFESLSGGEQTKMLLAFSFINESDFPLLDEPTNHLDIFSRQLIADYLKKKKGFIVVSHDTFFLNEIIDHVIAIEKNRISVYHGNYTTFENEKSLRDEFEKNQNQKLKKEITRLQETAQEKSVWSISREGDKFNKRRGFIDSDDRGKNRGAIGASAAKMMKRSKVIENRANRKVEEKKGLLKNLEESPELSLSYAESHHKHFFKAENLSFGYNGIPLCKELSFEINKGDIISLVGPNGSGKTTLFELFLQESQNENLILAGTIKQFHKLKVSHVKQNFYSNSGTIQEFCSSNKLDGEKMMNCLWKLGLERKAFNTPIEAMSMGQQKKIELAQSLITDAEIYFWDEPLNYLDVYNHEQIKTMIMNYRPTIVLIDHNRDFVNAVSNKEIRLIPINH